MPLINTYHDGYLKSLITVEREARAAADVAAIGTFAAEWESRLTVLRAYILTCLESSAEKEDLFAAKLAIYRKEFDQTLAQARAATTDTNGNTLSSYSISIERA